MQRYFSNEPPVYSKPKQQSGPTPTGSRPSQLDVTPRPPPPVPRPPVVQPPPAISSPLASSSSSTPSRPTPPPRPPASTIPPAIPHPLPPTAHTPHSDHHSPIPTQHHTTVSLDRDPVPCSVCPSSFLNLIADHSSETTSTAASIFVPFTALAQPRSNSCTQ